MWGTELNIIYGGLGSKLVVKQTKSSSIKPWIIFLGQVVAVSEIVFMGYFCIYWAFKSMKELFLDV